MVTPDIADLVAYLGATPQLYAEYVGNCAGRGETPISWEEFRALDTTVRSPAKDPSEVGG